MRIVILYNSSWYVFLLRKNLIVSFLDAGHSVTVVAPEDAYTQRVKRLGVAFAPISLTRSGTAPVGEARTLGQVYLRLRTLDPDAVCSFTVKCNLYAGLCKRGLRFRHIANISGLGQLFDGEQSWQRWVHAAYRFSLARTEHIFFQNKEDMAHLLDRRIAEYSRASLIPGSGVDLTRFRPGLKAQHGNVRSFLMFGRLLPKKGFYLFLEAAKLLKQKHGERVVFWILGASDPERSESIDLLARIMEAHARGIVRYLQSTDDPLPFIQEADAIVLPSTYNEGVPRSLLEALACGKPVVTTDWKGCRETIDHGSNGFLVQPDSLDSLVTALDKLVRCEDEELHRFGRRSRCLAEERFDEQTVIDAYHRALGIQAVSRTFCSSIDSLEPGLLPGARAPG
jgi:glycosyltransferase involved in cell wall biosynthesis